MADIAVANEEATILASIDTVLTAATSSGAGTEYFAKVERSAGQAELEQTRFTDSPLAIIRYDHTEDYDTYDEVKGKVLFAEIVIAASSEVTGGTRSVGSETMLTEITRLVNIVINAINTTKPTGSEAFSADGALYKRVTFRDAEIDTESNAPWAIAFLPIEVAYVISTETSN